MTPDADGDRQPDVAADQWMHRLTRVLGVPFTTGNAVEVLRNGDAFFPAMLAAIEASRRSIDMGWFVWWRGAIAERVAGALAERARAGVQVRLVLDEFGAKHADDTVLDTMRRAGVDLRLFRSRGRWKFWETNHRTHRRTLVCDGTVAFTGGFGIAEEWTGDARGPGEWRDTGIRVEGPAVTGIHGAFYDTWSTVGPIGCDGGGPLPAPVGSVPVQVIQGSSRVGQSDVARLFRYLFDQAQRSIRMSAAYLVPDEALGSTLRAAARRGVRVDLAVPGAHVDRRIGQLAGEKNYAELLDAGVAIHAYQPAMMHAKVLTIDDEVAVVGTANLNARSTSLDQEVEAVIADPAIAEQLDAHLDEDIRRSRPAQPPRGARRVLADLSGLVDAAL